MSSHESYDLLVAGAGPAGLAAAVGSRGEEMTTLLLYEHLGGQAGTTSRIENLPFYPDGVSGPDLINDMIKTNRKFKNQFRRARIEGIESTPEGVVLHEDRRTYYGHAGLIACGVDPRHLDAKNIDIYTDGRGVEFMAPDMQLAYKGKSVYIAGGGNSAGQAARFLSTFAGCKVNLVVRGDDLRKSMSGTLASEVEANKKINVLLGTEITALDGDGNLEEVTLKTGSEEVTKPADKLFVLIGTDPRTAWLPEEIECDERGYVLAGRDLSEAAVEKFEEEEKRAPFTHETAMPGVFAVGDIMHGSTPRIGYAAGEGLVTATEIWHYLQLRHLRDGQ